MPGTIGAIGSAGPVTGAVPAVDGDEAAPAATGHVTAADPYTTNAKPTVTATNLIFGTR
jgi:hypothetical protein